MSRRTKAALRHWPEPTANQTEVLLLGTYHMDQPGLDVVNVDADDVLAPDRQQELEALADRLEPWEPDAVVVERPQERQDELDALYGEYRTGERAYDEESQIDPAHPARDDPVSECRSEVVQVGFRVADRLDHDRVHAVDDPAPVDDHHDEDADLGEMTERAISDLDVSLPDPAEIQREQDEHLADSSIVEHLRWTNRESNLHDNHDLMFAAAMAGTDRRYAGSRLLAGWYARNLRIIENTWRAAGDADRILQVVGGGHVHVLRHLYGETPMFCPASPLPVLGGPR
jgi:hypothetical protein